MKCMFCDKPATVHLTDIVNKQKREAHLCESCAREKNLLPDEPGPVIDLSAYLQLMAGSPEQNPKKSAAWNDAACPACGMSYGGFKAEGRFGCAKDYDVFSVAVEQLLERAHRATAHVGKVPAAIRREIAATRFAELRTELTAAVEAEDYEQAARLRDLIRTMEAEGRSG